MGSKFWLLQQARNDFNTLNHAKAYATDALQWLIDDGHTDKINIDAEFVVNGIQINIDLYRNKNLILSRSFNLWENT
jgi:phage gp46-like protein